MSNEKKNNNPIFEINNKVVKSPSKEELEFLKKIVESERKKHK